MPRGNGGPRGLAGLRIPLFVNPYDDTFDGSSLNSKWTLSGTSPGPSVASGACTFSALGSGRHIKQLLAGTFTNFTLYARLSALSTTSAMSGLFATDSSGVGVGWSTYNSPNGTYLWNLAAGTVYSTTGPSIGIQNVDMWLRLRKAGSNWYGATAAHNSAQTYLGQSYSGETSALSNGAGITTIGFGSFIGGGSVTATLEEFRFVAA